MLLASRGILVLSAVIFCSAHVPHTITGDQVDELVEHSCLLLALPPFPQPIKSLFSSLSEIYSNDSTVYIALLEHSTKQPQWVNPSKSLSDDHVVFYKKRVKDLSCLLSLPISSEAVPYTGPLTTGAVVDYLNHQCDGFRTVSGSLGPAGLLRDQLMSDLFQLPSPHSECPRITADSLTREEFFWKHLSRSHPVIIEGAVSNWPAMRKWTMAYLRRKYGSRTVHIKMAPNGCYEGVEPASLWPGFSEEWIPQSVKKQLLFPDLVVVRPATAEMKFSEFIDLISADYNSSVFSAYLEYSSITHYMPELEEDLLSLPFVEGLLVRKHLNMWLSDGNTLGKLHFDPYDNLLCQLSGEKRLTLFDPHHNENMYEAHIPEALLGYTATRNGGKFHRKQLLESTSMVMSPVDITNVDLKRFPLFERAKRMECTLKQGDALFMPAFWWHEVQSQPNTNEHRNLAVNFWYEPLYSKQFPCQSCRLHYNTRHYRHHLESPPTFPSP